MDVGSFVTWELMACDGLKGCGIEDGSVVYRGLVVCSRAVGCVVVEDGPVRMRRLFVRRVKSSCSEVRSLRALWAQRSLVVGRIFVVGSYQASISRDSS